MASVSPSGRPNRFNVRLFLMVCIMTALPILTSHAGDRYYQVAAVSPSGENLPSRHQIVIRFDRDMVPLGDMARSPGDIPVTVTPGVKGQWRWLNTKTLALQLNEDNTLELATVYQITIAPGIRALDGTRLREPVIHTFSTRRPRVNWVRFADWTSPGTPVMVIYCNQPVTRRSLETHIVLQQESPKKTGVSFTLTPDPEEPEGRIWWLTPDIPLPPDTPVSLKVTPGLISRLGPAPGMENRVITRFHTFPRFEFLGLRCYTRENQDKPTRLPPETFYPVDPGQPPATGISPLADPDTYTELIFSTPVGYPAIRDHVHFTPSLSGNDPDFDPWAGHFADPSLSMRHQRGNVYGVPLPRRLVPWIEYRLMDPEGGIRDVFDRPLPAPLSMTFFTDHRRPDFQLLHPAGVLEKGVDSQLPVAVTNMDEITFSYDTVSAGTSEAEPDRENRETLIVWDQGTLTKTNLMARDITYHTPMGLRKMLKGKTGAVYGQVSATRPELKKHLAAKRFFGQVSPWQIHAKIGHFNALIWVTGLDNGQPVSGVRVSLHPGPLSRLTRQSTAIASGITDDQGIVLLPGTRTLDPKSRIVDRWSRQDSPDALILRIRKDEDLALLPLDHRFMVHTPQVSGHTVFSRMQPRHGHIRTWGTTAQGIYRTGDTIQYKIFVRSQDNTGFTAPPPGPYTLEIIDPAGKTVVTRQALTLSRFGACHGEYTLPKTCAVGWYRFRLSAGFTRLRWTPLTVLVSEFTPSPFQVKTELNQLDFRTGDTLKITTRALLHSGGPFTDARTRVTARLTPTPFQPGTPDTKDFRFHCPFDLTEQEEPDARSQDFPLPPLLSSTRRLDGRGRLVHTLALDGSHAAHGRITVESAVQDDRGKSVADTTTAPFTGRDRYVGLKSTRWIYKAGRPASMETLVVDSSGTATSGTPVRITVQRLHTQASRVKGPGNAFLTRYVHQWEKIISLEQPGDTKGPQPFSFTPDKPGQYRIIAEIHDTRGMPHTAGITAWVTGRDPVLWQQPASRYLPVVAEKTAYQAGETADYLIKNPFPGATALITLERYGILRQWTRVLETATPVVSIPITPDLAPGFYLSVTVVSPRVAAPLSPGKVDLGKPDFRTGYVKTRVHAPDQGLQIKTATDRPVYRPGDTVHLTLEARDQGAVPNAPVEFAVAVLDQAVFDLLSSGKAHFDIRRGFSDLEGLDVTNYSLLTQVVGRRLFEKKGANTAGDGSAGALDMRSFFKFVSYWNPALTADDTGRATADFTLPDNLTGWRIFAVAVTPSDGMGLGEGSFKTNRPTEIRPVMPNQVTAGDRFQAGFTVMNRTDHSRTLTVTLSAAHSAAGGPAVASPLENDEGNSTPHDLLPATVTHHVDLPPFKRRQVTLPVQTREPGRIRFTARAFDDQDADGIRHDLTVLERRLPVTQVTHGRVRNDTAIVPVLLPETLMPGSGRTRVTLAPTVLGGMDNLFETIREYPYTCWEQQLSRAVMAASLERLPPGIRSGISWKKHRELPGRVLSQAADFQAPNGGMVFFKPENHRVSPYLSAYTALAFQWLKQMGETPPSTVSTALNNYLEDLLRTAPDREKDHPGRLATVRAVALNALAMAGRIGRDDLVRFKPHQHQMDLFGKAHFLMAAAQVPECRDLVRATWEEILSFTHQAGDTLAIIEPADGQDPFLLGDPLRTQGALLSALTAAARILPGQDEVGQSATALIRDIVRAQNGSTAQMPPQTAAFFTRGVLDFSSVFEPGTPDLTASVHLEDLQLETARFRSKTDPPVTISVPEQMQQPGAESHLEVSAEGSGTLYYTAALTWSPGKKQVKPVNAGMEIHREIHVRRDGRWIRVDTDTPVRRGEKVQVDLFVALPSRGHFLVVEDPVSGGLEPINPELATASAMDARPDPSDTSQDVDLWPADSRRRQAVWQQDSGPSAWYFYHHEIGLSAVRFYADEVPAGRYRLSYTAQAICPGTYSAGAPKVHALYTPDRFGHGAWRSITVIEDPDQTDR